MRTIGFHASKGIIRFVVLEGTKSNPSVLAHERRPLLLISDRPEYIQNARNLFGNVLATWSADTVAYVLSMNASSQDQLAGLVLPFGALNVCARENGIACSEFIAANFAKTFFVRRGASWGGDRYKAADTLFGTHSPNWTNSERLAAIAAWGIM